jgi:hypothetical protein
MTGDGTSNEHKRVTKEKGLAYGMAIINSTLQRGECSMAIGSYYMPSLVYGTPETTLSYKECEDVQRAVVAAILPNVENAVWLMVRTTCLAWRMAHQQLPYYIMSFI